MFYFSPFSETGSTEISHLYHKSNICYHNRLNILYEFNPCRPLGTEVAVNLNGVKFSPKKVSGVIEHTARIIDTKHAEISWDIGPNTEGR